MSESGLRDCTILPQYKHVKYNTKAEPVREQHINFDVDLARLKCILVCYRDGEGVTEEEYDGQWYLMKGGEVYGTLVVASG